MQHLKDEGIPVDLENVLTALGNDTAILSKIVLQLGKNSLRQLAELQQHIDARHLENIRRIGHTMKGSLANFGADRAVSLARSLETMAGAEDLSIVQKLHDDLRDEISKIIAYFARPDWQADWL